MFFPVRIFDVRDFSGVGSLRVGKYHGLPVKRPDATGGWPVVEMQRRVRRTKFDARKIEA